MLISRNMKLKILLLIIVVVEIIILEFFIVRLNEQSFASLTNNHVNFITNAACKIPHMNPWDSAITKYIKRLSKTICNKGIPSLYASNFTHLNLNETSLPYYNIPDVKQLKCCYQEVKRRNPAEYEKDNKIEINSTCTTVENNKKIEYEFIMVTCRVNNTIIYIDIFWYFQTKRIIENKTDPNVLIVGLDSVSRLNLYRQMPKTIHFLKGIGSVDLQGYNKVDDNTFLNLLPVLTGKTEKEIKKTCWINDGHFDNCTFLWNIYKNNGYITSFGEDASHIGIFNLQRKGFIKQPTDYVYGYFSLISETLIGNSHIINMYECIGARMVYKDFLNYISNFVLRMTIDKAPYFAFYWGASLSHDYLNMPGIADEDYYQFFKSLHDSNQLNNTFLIFMSDHGMRSGDIRLTYQGMIEERMPFVFLHFPEWYREQFPKAYNNLLQNANKLTTPFDLHETLLDLISSHKLTDEFLLTRNTSNNRGISLFNEISDLRSCKSAKISVHWCICRQSTNVPTNDTKVINVSKFILYSINKKLESYSQCSILNLTKIVNSNLINYGETSFQDYMIQITTSPGDAIFESTVRVENTRMSILGTVSRLNLYGNQSHCITDFHLKLYCYCVSLLSR